MARRKKNNTTTPELMATAVSEAVAAALNPISQKLDHLLNNQAESVKLDDDTLDLMGVQSPEELGDILEQAADIAADALESSGDAVAAAVVDAGLDTGELIDELVKNRKSRKSAGEELEIVTAEEVAEVIEEVATDIAGDLSENEVQQLVDDGLLEDDATKETSEEDESGAKRHSKKRGSPSKKSKTGASRQTKQAHIPPFQRKYGEIYLTRKNSQGTRERKDLPPVVRLARAVKCSDVFAQGNIGSYRDPERAAWAAKTYYKDDHLARQFKGMSTTQPSSAGFLVPQDYVNDVVEMLYNQTVIFELGAQRISMPHGNLSIPRQTSGARAHFIGEARPAKESQPVFNMLHLSSKQMVAMVRMTEQILRSTDISSDMLFGNDLMMQMKLGIEFAALLGPGTAFAPLGLMRNPKVENVNLLTVNDIQIADAQGRATADLPIFVRGKVRKKNVLGNTFGWTFNSDAEQYFMRMKSTDGKFIWKEEMDKGSFNGDPYRTTNMVPTDMSKGTTSLLFGNWSDLLVGEQFGLETRTSYDATIRDDSGQEINMFETVQTVTRATMYTDMGNRHDESFIKVTNLKIIG